MIFLAKHIRYDIPPDLADHLAKRWREDTPFEPDVIVIEETGSRLLEGGGGWFRGNLHASRAK